MLLTKPGTVVEVLYTIEFLHITSNELRGHARTFKQSEKSTLNALATVISPVARVPLHNSMAACAVLPLLGLFVVLEQQSSIY